MTTKSKLLVIGANGLVGSHLQASKQVVAVTRENNQHLEELVKQKYAAVVFLAQSSTYAAAGYQEDLLTVNAELLRRTLTLAAGSIPRAICFSTGSVYQPSDEIIKEDSPLAWDSDNPYVTSKLCGELVAQTFSKDFETLAIVRPFFIYGSGQRKSMLFSRLAQSVNMGKEITIGQNGGMSMNPIHVSDVVRFIEHLSQGDAKGFHRTNLFGPEKTTLEHIVKTIGALSNSPAQIEENSNPLNQMVAGSIHDDFKPLHGVEAGLSEMLQRQGQ